MSNLVNKYEIMRKLDIESFENRMRNAKRRAINCMERGDLLEAISNCIYALELQAGMVEAEYQHNVVRTLASIEEEEVNVNQDD